MEEEENAKIKVKEKKVPKVRTNSNVKNEFLNKIICISHFIINNIIILYNNNNNNNNKYNIFYLHHNIFYIQYVILK